MRYQPALVKATLKRRYKRFLADVVVTEGEGRREREVTVHCPNTGSMKNCIVPDSSCWLAVSNNPKRKYRYTWELATTPDGGLACINTHRANSLVEEGITNGVIEPLQGYTQIRREVAYAGKSRIDFLLQDGGRQCFVEVKSVTLSMGQGLGLFPDAKSERAIKHLEALIRMRVLGHRAVLLYCVQHTQIDRVAPANVIHPQYAEHLQRAAKSGVEIYAWRSRLSPSENTLAEELPVVLDV